MLKKGAVLFAGIVIGAILMVALNMLGSPTPERGNAERREAAAKNHNSSFDGQRLGALGMNLDDEEDERDSNDEEVAAVREAFSAKVAAHHEAQRRAGWSDEAEASFLSDFSRGCGDRCETTRADCRFETCTVDVRFPTAAAAEEGFPSLLHMPYATNCAVEVVLPDPVATEPDKPTDLVFLLDCHKLLNHEIDEQGQPVAHNSPVEE